MPESYAFRKVRTWFERYHVSFRQGRKATHWKLRRVLREGTTCVYVIVRKKGMVDGIYVKKARRALKLTAKDGVPDREFFGQ